MEPTTWEEQAWRAILARDETFDGELRYGVVTTGVYCRPGCPARRPLRENARFFANPAAARRSGFRACRRCRPDETRLEDDPLVRRVVEYVETHLAENVTLEDLGRELSLSPSHLQRRFRELTGISPQNLRTHRRLSRFRAAVRAGEPVATATYTAGFGSSRSLYEAAPTALGMTPGRYSKGGAGVRISHTSLETSLGLALIASTETGICAVLLGEELALLERALRGEFPAATLVSGGCPLEWVEEIRAQLQGSLVTLAVPLDLHGTPFQVRVWQSLREIPSGEVRAYGDIAGTLGIPGGAQAVGQACSKNPVAVLVPCHRAVRKDGATVGYRWGGSLKERLLQREREERNDTLED